MYVAVEVGIRTGTLIAEFVLPASTDAAGLATVDQWVFEVDCVSGICKEQGNQGCCVPSVLDHVAPTAAVDRVPGSHNGFLAFGTRDEGKTIGKSRSVEHRWQILRLERSEERFWKRPSSNPKIVVGSGNFPDNSMYKP